MLVSIHLRGAPAFDSTNGELIGPLTPVNFLFGSNGSGKTTISRAFADPDCFAGTEFNWDSGGTGALGVKVYNRDYVAETLKQASNLPGVFVLGKTSAEIQTEIDSLTGPTGSIERTKKRLSDLSISLETKRNEIAEARKSLREAAWSKRASVPIELGDMFTGFNNSKENLLARLLEVTSGNTSAPEDFEALGAEAAAVLAEDATTLAELPQGEPIRIEDLPGYDLLGIPVVGSAEVGLAPLIQRLQNADWVQHGRHYLPQVDGVCPFCQQSVPADLGEQLDSYFDTRYTEQIDQLRALQNHVQDWADWWTGYLVELPNLPGAAEHLNAEQLKSTRLELEPAIKQVLDLIASKLAGPSAIFTVDSPESLVDALNAVVADANKSIKTFNLRLHSRAAARNALLDRCWVAFARTTLATEVGRFEGAMPPLEKAHAGIESAVHRADSELTTKQGRLRELQAQVTSSKPIIDTINRLLDAVGFTSFRLKESAAIEDGYSLQRENGEIAAESLSEGERTFITFMYFAQSLQGAPQDSSEPNDLIAVIDDPISSLDSDVLYAVSTIVRKVVADIADGRGRVRQLVVLTHNAHFHKEVTYIRSGDKVGGWQYGVVRKRSGSSSELILSKKNPIQTAYAALWAEVKNARDNPHTSTVGLQNILRRILETYFRVLGGVDDGTIIGRFEGDDQATCRALFSWVNAGSHSILEDLNYSPTPITIDGNMRVFRQIFEAQDQLGHYLMMMDESAEGAAPAESAERPG